MTEKYSVSDEQLGRLARRQHDLFRRVREGTLPAAMVMERLQAIIEPPKPAPANSNTTYLVTVNYSLPLAKAIARGDFTGYLNPDITSDHFPATRAGKERVTLEVVHLDKLVTTQNVLDYLEVNNLRAATIEEFLAVCAKDKTLDKEFPVVALGSVWRLTDGSAYVPCADWGADGRELHLIWSDPASRWYESYRFVAVRKV